MGFGQGQGQGYSSPSPSRPGWHNWYDGNGAFLGLHAEPMFTYGPGGTWGPPPVGTTNADHGFYTKSKPKEKKAKVAHKRSIEDQVVDDVQTTITKAQVASLLSPLNVEQRQEVIEWLEEQQTYGAWKDGD